MTRPRPTVEIPLPELARACGYGDTRRLLRRLREARIVLRQRGQGAARRHYFTTYADLVASEAAWIPAALEQWALLFARRGAAGEDE